MGVSELTASAVKAMSNISIGHQNRDAAGTGQNESTPLSNRAGESKNTYVKSHASSPVAWQPLDSKTIELAKADRKLIFLHIGYNACHYCRLMSTESFNNAECAAVLNESFVPIIIDREERPDLDSVYMNYVQAVSNVGGWPLNLFLTPDMEPVFGGTYWPGPGSSKRGSRDQEDEEPLDFLNIAKKVRNIWKDQEARCRKEASDIVAQLREFAAEGTLGTRSISAPHVNLAPSGWAAAPIATEASPNDEKEGAVSSELDLDQLEEAYTHIAGTFDPVYGGFGLAPKFLTPPKLEFLLRLNRYPEPVQDVVGEKECKNATDMAVTTLRRIRDGALHDHVGQTGFSRCSVTPDWSIPNFEKLVTDNALLLSLYTEAWKTLGGVETSEFFDIVLELADYLSSEPVVSKDGLFSSSEAADSAVKKGDTEVKEGAYYLWTRREFDSVIEAAEAGASQVAAAYWNVLEDGNVDADHDPNDELVTQNILRVVKTPDELSQQFQTTVDKIKQTIEVARLALNTRREKERGRPEFDEKAVVGWNGLVISSLVKASAATKAIKPESSTKYLDAATKAAKFIKSQLWDAEKKTLYRIWVTGQRQTEGFADDYVYLIRGLLDLFSISRDESLIEFADELQKSQNVQFADKGGAFFSTTANAPNAILRLKDGMDTSLPSINAIATDNLFELAQLLDDNTYAKMARTTINAFEAEMLQHPWLFPGLLNGVVTARLGLSGTSDAEIKYKVTRQQA